MSRRVQRAMDGLSALFALAAMALAFWPVRENAESGASAPPSLTAVARARGEASGREPVVDSTAAGIVQGNVFSSSRRAPAVRFMPPGSDGAVASAADAARMSAAANAAYGAAVPMPPEPGAGPDGVPDAVPALYGIVGIEGVRHALLLLRGGEPPRLFAVGDRHAGYRISAIERDRVVLATSRGSRTLRLTPSASRDSSENSP